MAILRCSVTALLCTAMSAGCGEETKPSQWVREPMVIDGVQSDWAGLHLESLRNPDMILGISNDAGNLYIMIGLTDETVLRRLLIEGGMVWIDQTGGKHKDFGLRFRIERKRGMPGNDSERRRPSDGSDGDRPEERTKGEGERPSLGDSGDHLPRGTLPEEAVILFNDVAIVTKDLQETPLNAMINRPTCACTINHGQGIIEFRIPLFSPENSRYRLSAIAGEVIGVGLQSGEMNRALMRDQTGGQRGGDDGGMMGGGPGGMGRPGGLGNRGEQENQELWFKVQLATAGTRVVATHAKPE